MMKNETFLVGSLFRCDIGNNSELHQVNTLWRQTVKGCKILKLLEDIYQFNLTFIYQKENYNITSEIEMYHGNNSVVDIFVRPMSLTPDVLNLAYPIAPIFDWNFGFTIILPELSYPSFYSKPFTRQVWNCLYGMALMCSVLFYLMKRYERKVTRGRVWEASFGYEMLMVFGAYFQHIPPIDAYLLSRRTAYLVFFLFAYVIYTFYTSNLLSHLVNDKQIEINLEELLNNNIECLVLEDVRMIIKNNIASMYNKQNISETEKLLHLRSVSIDEGLEAVRTTKAALLSDYDTINPFLHAVFTQSEMCNIAQIDVVSHVNKYLYVSHNFPYKEQFKLGILRAKESGLIAHLVSATRKGRMDCTPPLDVQTPLAQVILPLGTVAAAAVLSLFLLILERVHYRRNKLWPYVN